MGRFALTALETIFWVTLATSIFLHLIYPLLLALACKIARRKIDAQPQKTSSILLWDDNFERAKNALSALLESPLPKGSEILLLGSASKIQPDKSPEFVRPIAETEKFDQSTAINFAVPKANGDILIIITRADSIIDRYSVRAMVACISETAFDCAFGISNVRPRFIHHSKWLATLSQDSNITNLSIWPSILAMRKGSWQPISSSENMEFAVAFDAIKRGKIIGICSASETSYAEPKKFMDAVTLMSRTMMSEAKTLFACASLLNPLRFGATSVRLWFEKVLLWLSPFFMYTAFFSNFILALLYQALAYQILMLLQSAFYFMALLGHSQWKRNKAGFLVSIFCFVLSSFSAAWMWQNYAKP